MCAVIKGNYCCVNAIAICPIAPTSLEGGSCFLSGAGMDEIRCVECRLLILLENEVLRILRSKGI